MFKENYVFTVLKLIKLTRIIVIRSFFWNLKKHQYFLVFIISVKTCFIIIFILVGRRQEMRGEQ